MDDLFEVEQPSDGDGFDELIGVDDPPDEEAEEEQPVVAGARDAELEAMRQSLANMEKRLGDTQANFHRENQGRQIAEALIQANRQEQLDRQRHQAAIAAAAPLTWTPEEQEAWLSDPAALAGAMQTSVEYGRQRTLAEVGPHIAQLTRTARLMEPVVHRAMIGAEQEARQISANQHGISDDEFTQLAPHVDGFLRQAAKDDEESYKALRLDPRVIATAMSMAKAQMSGGVPVNKSPRAPSFGAGGGSATGGAGTSRMPNRLVGTASVMEKKLGLSQGTLVNAPVRTRQGRL